MDIDKVKALCLKIDKQETLIKALDKTLENKGFILDGELFISLDDSRGENRAMIAAFENLKFNAKTSITILKKQIKNECAE